MSLRTDDTASTSTIAFLVAGAIFLSAIGVVLLQSHGATDDSASADAAAKDLEAGSLADLLVQSPGVGWSAGADGLTRLGLAASNGSGMQQSSIDALRGAMVASSANGKVDYEDAQRGLGMDPAGSQDFHIRMYPVGMDSVYDASLSGIRVGYIGNWLTLPPVTVSLGTSDQMAQWANLQFNLSISSEAAQERAALETLGLDYRDRIFMKAGVPAVTVLLNGPLLSGAQILDGDVYPDDKQYLDAVLKDRLPEYDILVIGSGVDHSALTANVVKDNIRDWVKEDGGTLVVLGSSSQNFQWLQPLFFTGVSTVNGAATAPDISHPLLKEPNSLSWPDYDTHGYGWDIKDKGSGAHYDDFSHVIVQGGEDVLAISKDGAFGNGRIILTSFRPGEVASDLGLSEAMAFFENLVLYADRAHLYIDYGPAAPLGTQVSIAVRQSWLYDDRLGQVPVHLEIQTWG